MNLLFASLYWLAGPEALAGADGGRTRFEDCFFFSVQTPRRSDTASWYQTPGSPMRLSHSRHSSGCLVVLSGLLFARFTRPSAKVSFSDRAVIAPRLARAGHSCSAWPTCAGTT